MLPPGLASTTITAGGSATAANSYYRYEYQLKDHLGNLRVACRCGEKAGASSPSDTYAPLVVQEQHYDPYGLDLTGLNSQPGLTASRFKFNGKEDESALGWIDFKWRHYDPALARFFNVDRLAEKFPYMTTYQFASNDPVNKIELDGLEGVAVNPSTELWKAAGFGYEPGPKESYQLGKTLLEGFVKAWATVALMAAPVEEAVAVGLGLGAKAIGLEVKETIAASKLLSVGTKNAKTAGKIANDIGLAREETVADLVGGRLAKDAKGQDIKIAVDGIGSTGLDVLGPKGEYIHVGGAAKGKDFGKFGRQLSILTEAAKRDGVEAKMYFQRGTPQTTVNFAIKRLGKDNVHIFDIP